MLAIPSAAMETWILAAQEPPYEPRGGDLECVPLERIEGELVRRKLARWKGGKHRKRQLHKSILGYGPLIVRMISKWAWVLLACTEAGRAQSDLRAAIAEIAAGRGAA